MGGEFIDPKECECCWKEILDDVNAWVIYRGKYFCGLSCSRRWMREHGAKIDRVL